MQQWQVQQFKLCRRSWRFTDSVPTVQTVQKIVEITQMQFLDKVVDIPVVVQRQMSTVQVVQKTVRHEERQMQPILIVNAVCVTVQVGDENYENASLLQLTAGCRRQRNSASLCHDVDDESSSSSSSSSADDEDSSSSGCSSSEG